MSAAARAAALLLAAGMTLGSAAAQEGVRKDAAGLLAVFADGRLLSVAGATLVDADTVRLDLGGGASLEVAATRLERVIEATPDPGEPVVTPPACRADWADEPLPEGVPFAAEIVAAARQTNLNPWLVATVIDAESRFDPRAVSRVGARGLMQLMPSVWRPAGLVDPHEPSGNIAVGCRYLRDQVDRFGDLATALAAYNAGPGAVARYAGVPPYRETRRYVASVLGRFCPGPCPGEGPCENPYNAVAAAGGEADSAGGGFSDAGGESPDGRSN